MRRYSMEDLPLKIFNDIEKIFNRSMYPTIVRTSH